MSEKSEFPYFLQENLYLEELSQLVSANLPEFR